ncbi:MAG: GTP cyclohydrolase I FolE [Chloroflexi bacterium]|nr:GTP cyclohydrolase I FolE [Chloroflexota bacterium]MBK6710242.1 GTP cyclohydrolase I FolE [Chloroflexota bacterium]MBK7178435.1 GTP cyclohydrolase I FolE [Chloroflexota bacterium]MBK8933384.1 GTP cyclohydrolase I FolE [Chloroflexota bacterium]MBP6805260.1 GTP cyclohydrolase I FolE [Chloroflexota bacterium]
MEHRMNHDDLEQAIHTLLQAIGENPHRPGLRRTPTRVAQMFTEILDGYDLDAAELTAESLFDVAYDEMILVKDIQFFSMCEHHLLPFFGRAHVAYVPQDKIIGLSKIPRTVDMFAHRLQVQERMTQQIAYALADVLSPQGLGVIVEGTHLCAMMRGVKKEQARLVTSAMLGSFKSNPATRQEFLDLLKLPQ